MTKEKKISQLLESKSVCEIYNVLHKEGLISFPLTKDSISSIESLVGSIKQSHFGVEIYESIEEKVVAYLYFMIKNHPFTDGNKRVAVITFFVSCRINNLKIDYKNNNLDSVAIFIEKTKVEDHHAFIKELAKLIFV